MKTYSAKPSDIKRAWHTIDGSGQSLGRLATQAAKLLVGKGKPNYTPHMDGGDFVIIINAAKVVVTGDKPHSKKYFRHSGYPGGLSLKKYQEVAEADPTDAIQRAVRGMLPDNKLRGARLKRLKVYAQSKHQHEAQTSQQSDVKQEASSDE